MRLRPTQLNLENLEFRRLLAAVSVPGDLTGNVAAIVAAPVNIDTATGVRGVEIRLNYNTAILNLDSAAVSAGSLWAANSDTQVVANVDDVAGTVVVFVSSSAALGNISGSLVQLNFTIASGATVGDTAALDLVSLILNEGAIAVTPAPIAGSDPTDGQILVSGDVAPGVDAISGFVFADGDQNGSLSPGEAIPGVTITLRNATTGAQQQALTNSEGRYAFTGLQPGSYQILQQQPLAYIDGGTNQLDVQLVSGVALANQNFVEVGLLPQFVYTRLLSTSVQPMDSPQWRVQIVQINRDANSGAAGIPASNAPPSSISTLATRNLLTSSQFTESLSMLPTSVAVARDSLVGEGEAIAEVTRVLASHAAVPPLERESDRDAQRHQTAVDQALLTL